MCGPSLRPRTVGRPKTESANGVLDRKACEIFAACSAALAFAFEHLKGRNGFHFSGGEQTQKQKSKTRAFGTVNQTQERKP